MRVVIVWREASDYGRTVREWLHDVEVRMGYVPETINPDEPSGVSFCKAYDVVEYPSILALDSQGRLLQMWRGKQLPQIDDVAYYMTQQ